MTTKPDDEFIARLNEMIYAPLGLFIVPIDRVISERDQQAFASLAAYIMRCRMLLEEHGIKKPDYQLLVNDFAIINRFAGLGDEQQEGRE